MRKKRVLEKCHPMVVVVWKDAQSLDEWTDKKDLSLTPPTIVSCGFVIADTNTELTLSLNHDVDNNSYSCMITIPRQMVLSVFKIK